MATFLQLVQKLRRESGITSASATGPSTVVSQTGEMGRIVDWAKDAYTDIQNRHFNWRWMRKAFTVNTVASTVEYAYTAVTDVDAAAAISRFSHWWAYDESDQWQCYLASTGVSGQYWLRWLAIEDFRRLYKHGTIQTGPPVHVAIDHKNQIALGPSPDAVYTVTGDYQRSDQILALDATVPEMPTQFHNLIVWYALESYGFYESAPEAIQRAVKMVGRQMPQLEKDQLPELGTQGPMA